MRIYTYHAGQKSGPQSLEDVQAKIQSGALSPTTLAWYEGVKDWIPLTQVPGLKFPEAATPPRQVVPPPLPISLPPALPTAAPPQLHLPSPPPRKLPLIVGAVGAIFLALVLFGVGLNLVSGPGRDGSLLLGLVSMSASVGLGVASIQFFLALSRNPTGRCKVCGQYKPTLYGSMNRHIGAVILMFHAHISGHLCKDCIRQIFWNFTPLTLGAGWWGIISFFVTPVVLVNNVAFYVRSRLMK